MSSSQCKEASVRNNTITFDSNSYYKFVDENEEEHKLVCKNNSLGALFSESMSGTGADAESSKYAKFWNCAGSEDPTFIGLDFSKSEIESYFSQAGIEPGSVFKIGEESYILNDDYTLDIPYGADIYNMTCPPIS